MLSNYVKIAWRHLTKHKIYSAITMSGLVLGLGVFILFALLLYSQFNFDLFHKNADRIYCLVQVLPRGMEKDHHSAITPAPLKTALLDEFPEIEKASRFFPPGRMVVRHEDKIFYENRIRFVDADFLSIFTFNLIRGETETVLTNPYTIVLTEASAIKYFGNEEPIGKNLTLNNDTDVIVTGIIEDVPENSSIRFDFLVSMETAGAMNIRMDDWSVNNQATFLLLSDGASPTKLDAKLSSLIKKYYADSPESPKRYYLHPLPDFNLNSTEIDCYWSTSQMSNIAIWIVAVLILIIACINFMNLSTARYALRANEVGMRKVIGAKRVQLIKQFLGESILMTLISFPVAMLFSEIARPGLIAIMGGGIFIASIWDFPRVLILALGVTILTGFFAGSYPAFYVSAFQAVQVFKGRLIKGKKGSRFRKILVITQFTFSIILILMTIITVKQTNHNLKVDLGFDRSGIIAANISHEAKDKLDVLKKELVKHADIVSVSAAAALPIEWDTEQQVVPEGLDEDDALNMNTYGVDYGFIEMLGMEIRQGRSFSQDFADVNSVIINETAVGQLQWENPIGKQLVIGEKKGIVIGVTEDYHFKSIYLEEISPAVLYLDPEGLNYMYVKVSSPDKISSAVEYMKKQWNTLVVNLPFEYETLENAFEDMNSGDKTAELTGALALMAIFLSCLGLFGLSSYAVERRLKEIGIRKVLGASVSGIVQMLIKDFMKLVVIANIIAIPIAYFFMNKLIHFIYAYPINIGAGVFIICAVLSLLVAFITVSSQTIKSALLNPAESLRYE
ncbi:MAG: ABC transporter permease [Candidatus Aminicenantes bacterium]|nr:ABC transporter permease [Candidatus Aminicenantes bacterium]MDH5742316.1 ABC transporter permease [Candidatus Aminicenantes bacterium]